MVAKKRGTGGFESRGIAFMVSGRLLVVFGFLLTAGNEIPYRVIGFGLVLVILGYCLIPHDIGDGDD